MGPFFWRFANALRGAGAEVYKINFCAGDTLFYPARAASYRGTDDAWPGFLAGYLSTHEIDAVFLFGDCRPIHRAAVKVVRAGGLELYVFEEGYLRPDYVTIEPGGVNSFSAVPRDPTVFEKFEPHPAFRERPQRVQHAFFWHMVYATFYFVVSYLGAWRYPHYRHHKPFRPWREGFVWTRGAIRKFVYAWQQRHLLAYFSGPAAGRYFLVPLQVERDAQVCVHSKFKSVSAFIRSVMRSFAEHAPDDTLLVFKHHPYDRGHNNYARVIADAAAQFGLEDRVHYVHDLHLPMLLRRARGTVVINSTVGLSSVHHRTPVCVLGKANYNLPGLTHQGALDSFWQEQQAPDLALYRRFRAWLCAYNQANGSFYAPLRSPDARAGLRWPALFARTRSTAETVETLEPAEPATASSMGRT
jgi:capsular polysaccharide export protein